jgi:4-hydroxy-tetrahydrodipicolinate reductase
MGKEVERLALQKGHEVVAKLDLENNQDGVGLEEVEATGEEIVIEFTWPDAVLPNIRHTTKRGLRMVVGTTGWYQHLGEAKRLVTGSGTGLVYGANFSIGANLLFKMTEYAATLFDRFEDYDPYVFEHHHRGKVDAPSGTAAKLGESIVGSMQRKKKIQVGNPAGRIEPDAVHVASLRAGTAFGQHRIGFDSAADNMELTLTSRGRGGLAQGALFAAEWIEDKKGFFEFSECLGL